MLRHPPGKPQIGLLFFCGTATGSDPEIVGDQLFVRILKENPPGNPFDLESSPVLAAMLDEDEKAQLKTAENAWLKYRDTNCEFVADQYKGGSIRPMIAAICLADVTSNRTTELKNQIKDRKQ